MLRSVMNEVINREFIPSPEKKLTRFDISVQSIPSDQHPKDNQDFFSKTLPVLVFLMVLVD